MNAITLSSVTTALGVMIGITATHHHQVNTMVERGIPPRILPPSEAPVYDVLPTQKPEQPGAQVASVAVPVQPQLESVAPVAASDARSREEALYELLAAIRSEQKALRRQISESNRDIDELTFRVDTHSDSFKPLRTESSRPRRLEDAVPDQPMDMGTGVLPPKR